MFIFIKLTIYYINKTLSVSSSISLQIFKLLNCIHQYKIGCNKRKKNCNNFQEKLLDDNLW